MNLMFAWHEYRKILLLPIESKIHIFSPSRNIFCLYSIGMVKDDFRILVGFDPDNFQSKGRFVQRGALDYIYPDRKIYTLLKV